MEIKIRFNTDKDKLDQALPPWRVLINGKEHLVQKVHIQAPSWTTFDEIEPGRFKWHISCAGNPVWDEKLNECTILAEQN